MRAEIPLLGITATWLAILAAEPMDRDGSHVAALSLDIPLVAYWDFDEASGDSCRDVSGQGNDTALERSASVVPVGGVFGPALEFAGEHRLRTPGKPDFSSVHRISLSAWVMPVRFERYNEIFRKEDGNDRVLFSFQENGTILSLGLNVNGYAECDARISPKTLLDGDWHHCAATFDGKAMVVYLDGTEIGRLDRPGDIAAGGSAPGCIGSSSGRECFQGTMDDLRIYAGALAAQDVGRLYANGAKALLSQVRDLDVQFDAFYVPGNTFAETLSLSRQKLIEAGIVLNKKLGQAVNRRLQADYPDDCRNFVKWAGMTPVAFLDNRRPDLGAEIAHRAVSRMTEYKPLTAAQWARQVPADASKWRECESTERRFDELVDRGDEVRFSPEWIEIVFAAAPRCEVRPSVREAVAPYVIPSTPESRDLGLEEAQAVLGRDWLHQADGKPTPERIRDEIRWARELATRIVDDHPAGADFADELRLLAKLAERVDALEKPDAVLYLAVRDVKRRIMFGNPVVDFGRVLFVDMPFPQGREWQHETRHRLGYMAVPGARLLILDGLSPAGKLSQLMPQAPLHGSFWRPDLSYDARKVVFCFKPHNEKAFHLYEIGTDGAGLRQLTDGQYDDLDPAYLPDGQHIVFSTTRGHSYVRCMPPTSAYVLARCDLDGKNIYLISRANEPDYLASVMDDGRIIYTRWEYTDKPLWRAQGLWTAHPDGTQVNTFWGNQSVWPDLVKDARSIPGSRRVMVTGSAHHNWFAGSVGIIDPARGLNFPDGITKVTADVHWPESGNGPVDPVESPRYHASGRYDAYYSPYPLSERDFLVSARRGGKFVLYLMDTDGNRELIYEGTHQILHALPVRPRPTPPVVEDVVQWPAKGDRLNPADGVIYSSNVLEGTPEQLRGKVEYLRVLAIDAKTYTYWHKRPYLSTGPVVSAVQSDGVKRALGTVPVEADGSVCFRAPTGKALHFQLLDADYKALQTMRSFTGVMPGENRGCLGCHEQHSKAPPVRGRTIALAEDPREITPPPWGEDTVSYPRYVRPVLDKYCARCHTGDGKGRATLDLTARTGFLGFDETYFHLIGKPTWGKPYTPPPKPVPGWGIADMLMVEAYDQRDPEAYRTPEPMTRLSYRSRLIDLASSGKHHDVKVDSESLRRLILWVDTMCPYRGDEEVREIADPEFEGVDWLAVRPRIATAPRIVRPGPVD